MRYFYDPYIFHASINIMSVKISFLWIVSKRKKSHLIIAWHHSNEHAIATCHNTVPPNEQWQKAHVLISVAQSGAAGQPFCCVNACCNDYFFPGMKQRVVVILYTSDNTAIEAIPHAGEPTAVWLFLNRMHEKTNKNNNILFPSTRYIETVTRVVSWSAVVQRLASRFKSQQG